MLIHAYLPKTGEGIVYYKQSMLLVQLTCKTRVVSACQRQTPDQPWVAGKGVVDDRLICCTFRLSDAEQRVRKRRRRDLEDEDYEVEPVQPRRVSARKANQVGLPYVLELSLVLLTFVEACVGQ